jgi:carbamoyltransferase
MGLAPYGNPGIDLSTFINPAKSPYRVHAKKLFGNGARFSYITPLLGAPREPESDISDQHKNIAFAVQASCEAAIMFVVKMGMKKTGSKNLCMAGGVALNSKANDKIVASGITENVFVPPAASDDGVALGAAMAPYLDGNGRLPNKPMRHGYWGPSFDDNAIQAMLPVCKIRHTKLSDPAATAAQLLSDGKILGWFQGRMEFGPRALGSRSILADPRDPEMNAKVMNNAVKFREWWRPFAPSFKKEAAPEYLESAFDSPFMIFAAQVRPEKRSVIPYYRLIDEFGKITGVPVIMNTSFNLRGEAIVHTPTDALRTFFSSGMDALVIGSFLVEK